MGRRFFRVVLLSLVASFFAACSFSLPEVGAKEDNTAVSSTARLVTVKGSLKFQGARPSAFTRSTDERTAFPSTLTEITYKITARQGSSTIQIDSRESSAAGSITVGTDEITYTIVLTEGSWLINASASDAGGNTVLASAESVSVNLDGSDEADPLLLTFVESSVAEKGSVKLNISYDSDTGIQGIKVSGDFEAEHSGSNWDWQVSDVNPGSYKVNFSFYPSADCSGNPIYHIRETVNVYSNLTTDTFESSSGSYVSSGKISITKAILEELPQEIYVSADGSDSATGSFFNPVKTLADAIELVNNSSATESITVKIQGDVALGRDITLNLGKKLSIESAGSTNAVVSGGTSYALNFRGEAAVSNVNFSSVKGISILGSDAKLTINDCLVKDGSSDGGGGGFYVGNGAELVSEHGLVIESCNATMAGGGIYNAGTVILAGVQIVNCSARYGGSAIYNIGSEGSLTLQGNTSIEGSVFLYSKEKPLAVDSTFSAADTIELAVNSLSSAFALGDLVVSGASAGQTDFFTLPEGSTCSLFYSEAKGGAILAIGSDVAIYVGGSGASDTTGDGSRISPYATLQKAVAVAAERYAVIEDEYKIVVQAELTLTNDVEVKDAPGLSIKGDVPALSSETVLINGAGKKITFSCNARLSNLKFDSLSESSISKGPITIASDTEVEAEYVKVTNCTNTSGAGGGIYNSGTLTLKNCEISSCKATYSSAGSGQGGGIYCNYGSTLTLEETSIEGNEAAIGGGIYLGMNCSAGMTDSLIKNNTANNASMGGLGGGIYINENAVFTMEGSLSEITQNKAGDSSRPLSSYGGGVFCAGSMTMSDGTISSNQALAQDTGSGTINAFGFGGGVALYTFSATSSGAFTMTGGSICKNSASYGGGISNQGLNLELSGGTIGGTSYADANTSANGAGLYIGVLSFGSPAAVKNVSNTISGCKIEYNSSSFLGGGIVLENSTLDFTAGSLSHNSAVSASQTYVCGGGAYVYSGTLNLGGTATISSNTVSATDATGQGYGGGVYIYNLGKMTMAAGSVTDNTVSGSYGSNGGGIFSSGDLSLTGGSIKGNEAGTLTGGVAVVSTSTCTWNGTTITENIGASICPNYYINAGVTFSGQANGSGTTYSGATLTESLSG